ncbi:hypothetical protein [Parapedobacter tibetensis]|uniref:hypothetical protein n=1 Tax=Parapedobacter tibetensis TaxID=2972951 RepID=UPI00214D9A07|nr:hypothetical protein [Parapedobacter tibetensis]
MKPQVTSYAGMLDQSSFKQWYTYQKLCANHQYDAEEVSFLMSKPPFYFRDYAMLASGSKLTFDDTHILSEIFHGPWPKQLDFDKDDLGMFEKRIVRIKLIGKPSAIQYLITIPWTIKGKGNVGKLSFREEKRVITSEDENEIRQHIELYLNKLIRYDFFRLGRPALEVYREIEERCQWSPLLRPLYVKQALYQQISTGKLTLKMHCGQLHYQYCGTDFLNYFGR